jgi:sugar phosphate isomerase/epimerase
MTAFDLLDFAASLGLRRVQYADNLPLDALAPAERARLRAEAGARGIFIEVGTRGSAPEYLRRWIALAAEFESPILRVVVDSQADHPTPDDVIGRVRAALPDLRAAGVTLALENHDRFRARTLVDIVRAIDSARVGICLDTVNSFGALEGPEVVIAALGRYVINLHLKEFTVRRLAHNMGFEVTGAPAGQGMLDIPNLLAALDGFGRSYSAIIETWLTPLATMTATVEREQDWVRQSVDFLRPLIVDWER